jgi:hypothetical protein
MNRLIPAPPKPLVQTGQAHLVRPSLHNSY